jgi:hypothetical protein
MDRGEAGGVVSSESPRIATQASAAVQQAMKKATTYLF